MPRESRAVLLLLALAVAGHGARALLSRPAAPPGELLASITGPALDPGRQRARAERSARPLGRAERIDLNSATADEIARLPRIGMSLAKRIVADRAAHGPFRGPGDLDRVNGIGPALLKTLAEHLEFGGVQGALASAPAGDANTRISGIYGGSGSKLPEHFVDLNSASEADLKTLPGVGKARAVAILAYRRENGPFAAVSELGRVPGISQALLARLLPLLTTKASVAPRASMAPR